MNDETINQRQAIEMFRSVVDRLIEPCPVLFSILEIDRHLPALTTVLPIPDASPLDFDVTGQDPHISARPGTGVVRRLQESVSSNASTSGKRSSYSSKYESLRSADNNTRPEYRTQSGFPDRQSVQPGDSTRPASAENASAKTITPVISFARRGDPRSEAKGSQSRETRNSNLITQSDSPSFPPATGEQGLENDLPKPMELMEKLIDGVNVRASHTTNGQQKLSSPIPYPKDNRAVESPRAPERDNRDFTTSASIRNQNPVGQINNERNETPAVRGIDSFTGTKSSSRISNWTNDELAGPGAILLVDQLADEIISREKANGDEYPVVREQVVTPIDRTRVGRANNESDPLSIARAKSEPVSEWPAGGRSASAETQQTQNSGVKNFNATDPIDADSIASMINDILIEQARRHGVDVS